MCLGAKILKYIKKVEQLFFLIFELLKKENIKIYLLTSTFGEVNFK
jgi:hypothetical protein